MTEGWMGSFNEGASAIAITPAPHRKVEPSNEAAGGG
jgi:hypothetical protein